MDSSLSFLPPLPLAGEMKLWDKAAVEFGIPETMLMENAARSCCELLESLHGPFHNKKVLILMGGGNNGGDAVCMARHILDTGGIPLVLHLKDIWALSGACAWHTQLAIKAGIQFKKIEAYTLSNLLIVNSHNLISPTHTLSDLLRTGSHKHIRSTFGDDDHFIPDIIIDGLLGTGFSGALKPELKNFIENINSFSSLINALVFAIDIPSGLDALAGKPSPVAVRADMTATLAAAKPGVIMPHAREWTGKVYIRNIGMPITVRNEAPASLRMVDGRAFSRRETFPESSYKNIYGHLAVVGGAYGMGGAAHLSAAAALRCGSGLVTVCAPEPSIGSIKGNLPEIMTFPVGKDWPENPPGGFDELLARSDALIIGPGMGRTAQAGKFLKAIMDRPDRPRAVVDADALFLMAHDQELLAKLTEKDIITPHPGEAAALLAITGAEIQKDRIQAVKNLSRLSSAVSILKGAGTLLKQQDSPILLCPYDVPQMAIGGSGDVLAGCLGAMLGRRKSMADTLGLAARGIMQHVAAGLICARKYPSRGNLASDLIASLPHAESFIEKSDHAPLFQGLAPWPQ